MPSASASDSSAPGLIPKRNRPFRRWSSIAACAAMTTGWACDRLVVPVPSLMFRVSEMRLAWKSIELVMFSAASVRCSPTYASE